MPIPQESQKVSVDFPYEWDNPVEGTKETWQMRFIHNDYGPILQISQGPYEPIELPATMFLEVSEFLVRNGYMKGMPSMSQPKVAGSLPVPSIGRKPKPGTAPANTQMPARRGIGLGSFQPQAEDSEPVGALVLREQEASQEDAGAAQIAGIAHDTQPQAAAVSPEEAQKLLQARLAAKAKANTTGKQIRKNPKYDNGEKE
jgi:hypothetical protein